VPAGDTDAQVVDASVLTFSLTTLSIGIVLIAAVEDDVIRGQVGHQSFEDLIADIAAWKREDEKFGGGEAGAERFVVYQILTMLLVMS
jgi:hypothetical protein